MIRYHLDMTRVIEARERKKMTRYHVYKKTGVPAGTQANWEKKKVAIKIDGLKAVLRLFRINLSDVIVKKEYVKEPQTMNLTLKEYQEFEEVPYSKNMDIRDLSYVHVGENFFRNSLKSVKGSTLSEICIRHYAGKGKIKLYKRKECD